MSANIPFDIQVEITKRVLPVKSLIRFRSVSKQWKSVIDSSEFITDHSVNPTQPHHLLIRYSVAYEVKYVSAVDDDNDSFKFSPLSPTVEGASMLGCSHGVVCLHAFHRDRINKLIVLWNPSIKKSVGIPLPFRSIAVGFGVCTKTTQLKIVRITPDHTAEVFTLTSGAWRNISINPPLIHKLSTYSNNHVVIDGVIHWVAYDFSTNVDIVTTIVTFDLTSEEFGEIALPGSLAHAGYLDISKLKESLALMNYLIDDAGKHVCDVWVMLKNGVSFTKLFIVKDTPSYFCIIGFMKDDRPILEVACTRDGTYTGKELEVYEPAGSKHMNGLGIYASDFNMESYTESLLLLNHSDSFIQ